MSKYIDADELKRSYAPLEGCLDVRTLDGAKKIFDAFVDGMPAADVVEVRHGRWIMHIDDLFPEESTMECDQCHEEQPLECDDKYCPNCGAQMSPPDEE